MGIGIGVSCNLFGPDLAVDRSGWRGDVETNLNGLYESDSAYCCRSH